MIRLKYRMSKTGVPILKDSEIDMHAELLLENYKPELLTVPQPLDVEDFTENYLGLGVHFDNLSHNRSILGMAVFNNRQIPVYVPELKRAEYCPVDAHTVVIDNSLVEETSEVLFRSTLPHECGHHVYHRQIFEENDFQISLFDENPKEKVAVAVCRTADIIGGAKQHRLITDHDWIEHHAKYFSAAVLMPKSAMKIICDEIRERLKDDNTCDDVFKEELLVSYIADTFFVSPVSARIRIKQLNLGINVGDDMKKSIFLGELKSDIFNAQQ